MLIRFGGKTYTIDSPVERPGEVQIEVDQYFIFPELRSDVDQMFRFSHSTRKLAFHMLREGVLPTWNKVRTSWFQRRIIGTRRLVLAVGRIRGRGMRGVAVGPANCPDSEILTFPEQCVAELSVAEDPARVFSMLQDYFRTNPQHARSLFYYTPYSGSDIPFALSDVLSAGQAHRAVATTTRAHKPPNAPAILTKEESTARRGTFDLFLAGAGVYPCIAILPYLKKRVNRHTVVDDNPGIVCTVQERYGFLYRDTACERAFQRLAEVEKPLVVIATYHSTHVPLAELALAYNAKAKVFIEKPPVTTREQLDRLLELRRAGRFVEIGYNRRYTDYVRRARALLETRQGPTTMTCVVREKTIPSTHWYYWPTQGTRVVGNLSHWIDLGVHLIGARPVSFNAMSSSSVYPGDDVAISIHFDDGSQLNLVATDRGSPLRGIQEYIDIRRDDVTIRIDDFMGYSVQERGHHRSRTKLIRDKGHKRMYDDFLKKCTSDEPAEYPQMDLETTCRLYLNIKDALVRGERAGQV